MDKDYTLASPNLQACSLHVSLLGTSAPTAVRPRWVNYELFEFL